jgi:predicted O-methyltransferase YrrM
MIDFSKMGCLKPYAQTTTLYGMSAIKEMIEYANSIDGFLCNMQIPIMYTFSLFQKGNMAEIGCWHGRTTNVLRAANKDYDLYCIDTFKGSEEHKEVMEKAGITDFKKLFENNLTERNNYQNIKVIQNTSEEASKFFPDNFFDSIWIDAAHDYENVKLDINSWLPKLRRGGIMLGHDFPANGDFKTGGFEDLVKAVTSEVINNSRFENFGEVCGIWGARKI